MYQLHNTYKGIYWMWNVESPVTGLAMEFYGRSYWVHDDFGNVRLCMINPQSDYMILRNYYE